MIKPVNLEALSKWVGHIPEDVVRDMADIAPMLSVLGYDPYANPPDYGKADSWVKDNTLKVKAEEKLWQNRANQLLQRADIGDETSNIEDTDSPDQGEKNDIHNRNSNRNDEQT